MKSMTYGVLPGWLEFEAAFAASDASEGGYTYTLKGSDARVAKSLGLPTHAEMGPEDLYEMLKTLREAWENGDDAAGDLASGMLTTLGFEWV